MRCVLCGSAGNDTYGLNDPNQGQIMSELNEFIYRIQPTRPEMLSQGPTPDEEARVAEHFQYLKSLLEAGVLILAGRTINSDPSAFGIVVFRAESEAAAEEIMNVDPAVSGGVMQAELFPYRVALMERS